MPLADLLLSRVLSDPFRIVSQFRYVFFGSFVRFVRADTDV